MQNEADLAAYNLREANKVNALRIGGDGKLGAAYDQNGMSTGGFNSSAYAPGFAGHVPIGGQQPPESQSPMTKYLAQNGGQQPQQAGPSNPYMPAPTTAGGGAPQGSPQGPSGQSAFGQSPWVQQTANALTAQSNQNLAQNVMPGIRSGAQSAGQYGGSRQGIAEGVAAGNAQTGLNSALASLYGNAYGMDQNASLQNKSLDNSYNLGLGNLALGNQGQMQNFYTNQRGQDLSQTQLGMNMYQQGNQGNLSIGQGQYNLGQTAQNAPLTALQGYNSAISPFTGFGQSSTQTSSGGGGGVQGFAGGALAGAQIAQNLGFGNPSQNSNLMSTYGNNTYSNDLDPMSGYTYGTRRGM